MITKNHKTQSGEIGRHSGVSEKHNLTEKLLSDPKLCRGTL